MGILSRWFSELPKVGYVSIPWRVSFGRLEFFIAWCSYFTYFLHFFFSLIHWMCGDFQTWPVVFDSYLVTGWTFRDQQLGTRKYGHGMNCTWVTDGDIKTLTYPCRLTLWCAGPVYVKAGRTGKLKKWNEHIFHLGKRKIIEVPKCQKGWGYNMIMSVLRRIFLHEFETGILFDTAMPRRIAPDQSLRAAQTHDKMDFEVGQWQSYRREIQHFSGLGLFHFGDKLHRN